MTVHSLVLGNRSTRLRSTGDLVDALGVPFSDAQLAAITAPLEPGVIIAGAGSGKTTVMAARVVWLVGIGAVRPEEVLGLTFTRKAAAELSSRVRQALLRAGVVAESGVDESGEQLIMTYDAFAARLVAEHGLRLGFEADPTMLTGATRYRLAARVVKAAVGPFEFISRLRPATVTERVLRLDADLQQHLVDPTELDKHTRDLLVALESAPRNNRGRTYADVARAMVVAQERLELASLVQEYQALKLRLGLVEFADQMAIAARLAVQAPPVSAALRSSFAVVLLDEYQDTSAAQAMMLRGLFSGSTPSDGLGHPVTAVGDPLQAIYGWRGAAASNILTFAETFRRRNGRPAADFALTVNRRSGHSILEVANQLSEPLRGNAAGPAGVGRLEPPAGAPTGQIRAATFDTWAEEVAWIGEQVVAARSDGPAGRWADIAVLTRRNADIAPLYAELCARDVPVEIVGLGGLLHLPEVMDVTATLRLVDDVTANPELVRLLTGPRWRIGPRDLAMLGRRAQQLARDGGPRREPAGARSGPDPVIDALEQAVADLDPTDVVSLLDALEDPGDEPYSAAARERFGRLAAEL
ncbi:MAG TPA: ATP-dependent helicase, partial [Actinomycetota bacterium]|nr:ATP-dependent helicase [Actinomycetota bacterium]